MAISVGISGELWQKVVENIKISLFTTLGLDNTKNTAIIAL